MELAKSQLRDQAAQFEKVDCETKLAYPYPVPDPGWRGYSHDVVELLPMVAKQQPDICGWFDLASLRVTGDSKKAAW